MAYLNAHLMYKRKQSECEVGDKSSVGRNAITQVMLTVGVRKCDGEDVTVENNIKLFCLKVSCLCMK